MGLIVITTVDYRTESGNLLDHRTGKTLTKSIGGQFYLVHVLRRIEASDILIGKIDACPASEVEKPLVFTEFLHTQTITDLHQGIVAGVLNGLPYGLHAMTIDIIAVDPGISDKLITITVKRVIRIDGTGLKGRGYGNRFEGRTKLKGVGNAEVTPHIVVNHCLLLFAQSIHLILIVPGTHIVGIGKVIAVVRGHGIDLAGLRIHDDDRDILGSVAVQLLVGAVAEFFIQLLDVFLHDLLDIDIQRGNQTVTVLRLNDGPLQLGILVEVAELPAVHAIENIGIVGFQPHNTVA